VLGDDTQLTSQPLVFCGGYVRIRTVFGRVGRGTAPSGYVMEPIDWMKIPALPAICRQVDDRGDRLEVDELVAAKTKKKL